MLLVQSFFYILMFYFCVLFPYRIYSAKGQTLKDVSKQKLSWKYST